MNIFIWNAFQHAVMKVGVILRDLEGVLLKDNTRLKWSINERVC